MSDDVALTGQDRRGRDRRRRGPTLRVASGGGTGYGVVFRPAYGLLADSQGHLFGTAYYGGTVFEVTP